MARNQSLTVKETASQLHITNQAVYNLIKRGELPAFKVGTALRILESDLSIYIDSQKRLFKAMNTVYEVPRSDIFAVRHLSAHFQSDSNYFAVSDINFELPLGGTLGIIGPSGSGKTLLLKAISGLIPLDSGAIFAGKIRIDQIACNERRIGLVFQDYALYPVMNSGENIAFPLRVAHVKKEHIDPAIIHVAHELGIDPEYLPKCIEILPEGIKQLVAIGRASNRPQEKPPQLLLLDEPLIHLDARLHEETRAFLKSLIAHYGITTIFTFNDAADALALAENLLVINEGKPLQFGSPESLYQNPFDKTTMALLSINGVNTITGFVHEGSFSSPYCLNKSSLAIYEKRLRDGPAELCFRPENITILSEREKAGFYFRGLIERSSPYDGERNIYTIRLLLDGEAQLTEELPQIKAILSQGAEGSINFKPTSFKIFAV